MASTREAFPTCGSPLSAIRRGPDLSWPIRAELIDGPALADIEDPADLLSPEKLIVGEPEKWPGQPLPQGLGWFPKIAYPRCSVCRRLPAFAAGVPLKEETLGLVPRNQIALGRQLRLPSYDVRFNHGASAGLSMHFLEGGESVGLNESNARGHVRFFPAPRKTEAGPRYRLGLHRTEGRAPHRVHSREGAPA